MVNLRLLSQVSPTAIAVAFLSVGCGGGAPNGSSHGVGSITGSVRSSVPVDVSPPLLASVDRDVCGTEYRTDESLLVDQESLGMKNVVVKITSIKDAQKPRERDFLRALQQRDCRFEPHVLIVAAGREFSILNWDGIPHNTYASSSTNHPVNRVQAGILNLAQVTLKSPEIMEVACDAHDWMSAWIVVAEHRFYAITGERGEFRIEGVPSGKHELEFWHETLGIQTVQVTVKSQKNAHVELEYSPPEG